VSTVIEMGVFLKTVSLLLKDDAVDVWRQREIIWMRSEEGANSVVMRHTRGDRNLGPAGGQC
jgi:hypothetical protein